MKAGGLHLPEDAAPDALLRLSARSAPGHMIDEAEARRQIEVFRQRLIALQAMDTGGKDGTIRRVFSGVNPIGGSVARFERPTAPELARDYLWRVHARVPAAGQIVIFNRSH